MEPHVTSDDAFLQSVPPGRNKSVQNFSRRHLRKQLFYTSHDKDISVSSSHRISPSESTPTTHITTMMDNQTITTNNSSTPHYANPSRSNGQRTRRANNNPPLTLLPALIFLLISSFHIHSSSSSEITSFQQNGGGIGAGSTGTNNNNNFNSNNILSNNGIYSNDNNDDAVSNNPGSTTASSSSFQQQSAASSFIPATSPSSSSSESIQSQSAPTSVFIDGLANAIRKINSTEFLQLTTDAPFQLQFRTACHFGNIVYDDNIVININSAGQIAYSYSSNFSAQVYDNVVADRQWHTIKFQGNHILIVNEINNPSIEWRDPNSTSAEKADHYFSFFDGFVGCIRIPMDENENQDRSSSDYNDHEETFHEHPQSPSDHRILSLMKLFGLTNAQSDARCENAFDEIVSSHSCFEPDSFVLCEKCANSSGSCEVDEAERNNKCVCPSEMENGGKYCSDDDFQPPPMEISTYGNTSANVTANSTTSTTTKRPEGPLTFTWNSEDECPCKNGGECENTVNDQIFCRCDVSRYEGIYCQNPIDYCQVPRICNSGVCHDNKNGTYQCYCQPGYAGKVCDKNIQECLSNPCQNGGTCNDGIDEYTCECVHGYTGSDCETEINECDPNPCKNGATCQDEVGMYNCICVEGFADMNCATNIDDCESNPCQNGGECEDGINNFTCNCTDTGFEGYTCQNNVDDCIDSDCRNGGTCNDLVKGYNCTCNPGYVGDKCETDIDECGPTPSQLSPCLNEGECYQRSNQSLYDLPPDDPLAQYFPMPFDYRNSAGFQCVCVPGYDGDDCGNNIDDCITLPNGPSLCNNGTCHDEVNAYRCQCHAGYTGEKCEHEINECDSNPCQNGATCRDAIADYKCECPPNYGAKSCDVKLTGCEPEEGEERCIRSNTKDCIPSYDEQANKHNFQCKCQEGYHGPKCELTTSMSFNASGPVVITHLSSPEGTYELLFWFRTTLTNVILAVGSGGTYFSLTVREGKLNLRSSLLNNLEGIYSGSGLSNAEWHKVWISINSTHIALAAGSEQTIHPVAEHDTERKEDQQGPFNVTYLGGFTTELNFLNQDKLDQFSGCIRDVEINSERKILDHNLFNATTVQKGCARKDQCKDPNPCLNNGTCQDKWHQYKCVCTRPYLGNECQLEYIAGTFYHEEKNNSLVSVEIPNDIGMKFTNGLGVSMIVRTKQRSGTIFVLGHENKGNYSVFLKAEITENGNLLVQGKWSDSSTDSKADPYPVDSLQISDGLYHAITIQRFNNLVTIHVNETEHFRKKVSTNMRFVPNVLFIGGEPTFSTKGMDVSAATAPEMSSLVLSGDTEAVEVPQSSISGEDSTSVPEEGSGRENIVSGVSAEELAFVHGEPDSVNKTILVSRPFKGIIQDFRVNGSGPSGTQGMVEQNQNHYVVEFFPLDLNSTDAMGMSLGTVKKQNVLEGVQSDDTCKNNPCLDRGTCTVTWNDFQCDCVPEYAGKICDKRLRCADVKCPDETTCRNIDLQGFECYAEVAFDGKKNMSPHYVLKPHEKENLTISIDKISFRFRTKQPGTVLYIANSQSSFQIGLEKYGHNGSVVLVINETVHQDVSMNILDGEWHTVTSKMNPSVETPQLELYIDSEPQNGLAVRNTSILNVTVDGNFLKDLIMTDNTDIILGSRIHNGDRYVHGGGEESSDMDHPESAHDQFYRGCLADVRVGEFVLPVVTPSQLMLANPNITNKTFVEVTAPVAFYIQDNTEVSERLNLGCILCYESECLNSGTCANPAEKYECNCVNGFEGDTCERNIDECEHNECRNQSQCEDKINGYECICQPGYEGKLCEKDINECLSSECQNGGTCVDEVNGYSCQCPPEFTGQYCGQRKKAHCSDKPCDNGKCKELSEAKANGVHFECQCERGWTGEICVDREDYCENQTCSNHGVCENNYHAYAFDCKCDPGYSGPHCEIDIDECASNPCLNGGRCEDQIDHFLCDCTNTGFTGPNCEQDVNECRTGEHICLRPQECENTVGSYICVCDDRKKCGKQCDLEDPCFENGNKTCLNGGTCVSECLSEENKTWICKCLKDFGGEMCDLLTMARPNQPLDILLIIIPVLAALLIAATIAIVILVRMARRKRATRGVYSPSQQEYCNPRVELDNVMKPPPEERLI